MSDYQWSPSVLHPDAGPSSQLLIHLMKLKNTYGLKWIRPMQKFKTELNEPWEHRQKMWNWASKLATALDLGIWVNVHWKEPDVPAMARAFKDNRCIVEYGNEGWNHSYLSTREMSGAGIRANRGVPDGEGGALYAEYLERSIGTIEQFPGARLAISFQFWLGGNAPHWYARQVLRGAYGSIPRDMIVGVAPYLGTPIGWEDQSSVNSMLQQLIQHFRMLKSQAKSLTRIVDGHDIAAYELNHHMTSWFMPDAARQETHAALVQQVLAHPAMPTIYANLYREVAKFAKWIFWFRAEPWPAFDGRGNTDVKGFYGDYGFDDSVAEGLREAIRN